MKKSKIGPKVVESQGKNGRNCSPLSFHLPRHFSHSAMASAGAIQEIQWRPTGHCHESDR
jgi:hypothetical protein